VINPVKEVHCQHLPDLKAVGRTAKLLHEPLWLAVSLRHGFDTCLTATAATLAIESSHLATARAANKTPRAVAKPDLNGLITVPIE
jgi:hypothetical protein